MSDKATERRTYCNPVIDCDFPDPCVLAGREGFYFAFSTQTDRTGEWLNVPVARSRNLVDWEQAGDALPDKPRWASSTQAFMAPHLIEANGRFYLYFAAQSDDPAGMCLGVATCDRIDGPFEPAEEPLICGEGYNNIDPLPFDDPDSGKRFLYWGSGFEPIRVQELAADRISFAPGSEAIDLIAPPAEPQTHGFENQLEAAAVVLRDGYYYLFYSGDNCCPPDPHYAVMVARSRSPTGPFERMPGPDGSLGNVIVGANDRWDAPGHCGILRAGGEDWIFYHAIDRRKPWRETSAGQKIRRPTLLDRIDWRDGWPRVDGPSYEPRTAPAVQSALASSE